MKKLVKVSLVGALLITLSGGSLLAHAADVPYKSNGITEFLPGNGPREPLYPPDPDPMLPVEPIDPTNPVGEPNPGTSGPLTLDYASSWDFGQVKISSKDEKYYPNMISLKDGRSVLPYVQVSDFRGTNSGWSLFVRQESQFQNPALTHSELTGAKIFVSSTGWITSSVPNMWNRPYSTNGSLVPGGGNMEVFMAPEGTGGMTWLRTMGVSTEVINGAEKAKALELSIPGKTPKDAGKYSTVLTWTLMDVPAEPQVPIDPFSEVEKSF
ncbi:WxL domain-containing protein [Carnobacterium maltaromaticum]|uniref:WxL domain-containing protein n=1 Tax=Carnobacterium maltaromaticum TaxID=2751 RepID=UPI0039BDE002